MIPSSQLMKDKNFMEKVEARLVGKVVLVVVAQIKLIKSCKTTLWKRTVGPMSLITPENHIRYQVALPRHHVQLQIKSVSNSESLKRKKAWVRSQSLKWKSTCLLWMDACILLTMRSSWSHPKETMSLLSHRYRILKFKVESLLTCLKRKQHLLPAS